MFSTLKNPSSQVKCFKIEVAVYVVCGLAEYEHQLYICIFTSRSKYSPLKPDNVRSVLLHYTCERESEQSGSAFITQQRDGHGTPRPQASQGPCVPIHGSVWGW